MKHIWLKRAIPVILAAALLMTGFVAGTTTQPAAAQDEPVLRTNYENIFADIYQTVSPSVVSINILARRETDNPLLDDDLLQGGGTGFVYSTDGMVVTNAHVVDEAEEIAVYFIDGTIARAQVVGLDRDSDIAVIQVTDVPPNRLFPVTFGDSSALVVGQATLAIGSPFGEDWTLTSGIVSALNRSIRGLSTFSTGDVIQTDTAINPGNSGGPLLNLDGEVIGVNTQILSSSRSNSGIGFAVPSNLVQRVVIDILEDGTVDYSYVGIQGGNMTLDVIEEFELPNNLRGAVINAVVPGSPADDAGFENPSQNGIDVITAINGDPIDSMDDLLGYLAANTRPGDTVNVSMFRVDGPVSLPLTLGARPSAIESE
ncbi:MAG: trypsin-like peptidase domain-containing protein [Chloroflexota bacterium]